MEKQINWTKFEIKEDNAPEATVEIDGIQHIMESAPFSIPVNTIIGPIDVHGGQSILDHFDLWIMNTNFTVSKNDFYNIGFIEGVELIHPISKYKAIIGIGELFSKSNIKVEIEHYLTGKHKEYLSLLQLEDSVRPLAINTYTKISKYPYWIMYVIPNGCIEHLYTKDKKEFLEKIEEFKSYKQSSQGLLLYGSKD